MRRFKQQRAAQALGMLGGLVAILIHPAWADAAEPTVEGITDGVEHLIENYCDLKFEYTVKAKFWPAPQLQFGPDGKPVSPNTPLPSNQPKGKAKIVTSKDVFKILDGDGNDMTKPWRFWQRSVKNEKGTWVVDRWIAFNGKQSARFERRDLDKRPAHHGSIVPFEEPRKYHHNVFDRFLCTNVNGMPKYFDPKWKISAKVNKDLKITGSREFEGRRVYILEGRLPDRDLEYEVHVTGPPEFLIIHREARLTKDGKIKRLAQMEITKIGEFESMIYPAAGRFIQRAIGYIPRVEYEFQVTSVERLTDTARKDWRPLWPPDTAVTDQVNNKVFVTPSYKIVPAH